MGDVREAAVAGTFYPSDPGELRAAIETMLGRARPRPGPAPRALVVPHAGYIYSGPVAASAYVQLLAHRALYRRVALLGPAHRVPLRGLALPGVDRFRGPLGEVPVDTAFLDTLEHTAVSVLEAPHRLEHSLEVQLPFLQVALGRFTLVPMVVGDVEPRTVAEVLELLLASEETLVVVSTDLSHYLSYEQACGRDRATCSAIETLEPSGITHSDACGATALRGLLLAARQRGMSVVTLDLRNSGDTAGDRSAVVGYGAWMLLEAEKCERAA